MARTRKTHDSLLPLIRSTLTSARLGGVTDGELLTRFVATRDETAFTELVRRLGPIVFGVCRAVLGDGADAEDAFQVTFLVLARKAATVRPPGRVAAWLQGVATRAAKKVRTARARRTAREVSGGTPVEPVARPLAGDPDLAAPVHEELARLADRYRLPLVLCELRGLTVAQAAAELGWPAGTVASRLSRGRGLLTDRLKRRGLVAVLATGALSRLATTAPPCHLLGVIVASGAEETTAPPDRQADPRGIALRGVRSAGFWLVGVVTLVAGGAGPVRPSAVDPHPPMKIVMPDPIDRVKVGELADLLGVQAVVEDLGLTAEQAKRVDVARDELTRAVAGSMKPVVSHLLATAAGEGQDGKRSRPPLPNVGADQAAAVRAFGEAVTAVLRPDQLRRLKQITLQAKGPAALLDHRVVRALGLSVAQEDAIEAVLTPTVETPDPVRAAISVLTPPQRARWEVMLGRPLPAADLRRIQVRRVGGPIWAIDAADLPRMAPNTGGRKPGGD